MIKYSKSTLYKLNYTQNKIESSKIYKKNTLHPNKIFLFTDFHNFLSQCFNFHHF